MKAAYVQDEALYAAADLGSNSFHMIVTRFTEGRFYVVDRARTVVRLAAGIDSGNCLDPETRLRAFQALREFRARLLKVPPSHVRVVGTSALRRISDQDTFVTEARDILGLPIEIITGTEEARLINLGVAGAVKDRGVARLIIDIGGGSTEILVGEDTTVLAAESLPLGCVTSSRRFFREGNITEKFFALASAEVAEILDAVWDKFSGALWFDVIGTSGTIKATRRVIASNGWGEKDVTMAGVERVVNAVISAGHVDNLHMLKGLAGDRAAVFPGGLAILLSLMKRFGIESMQVSKAAMREGIVFDLACNK